MNETNLSGGNDHHPSTQSKDTSNREAEEFTGLAVAKPEHIEYEDQLEVSDVFYPTEDRALYIWS